MDYLAIADSGKSDLLFTNDLSYATDEIDLCLMLSLRGDDHR